MFLSFNSNDGGPNSLVVLLDDDDYEDGYRCDTFFFSSRLPTSLELVSKELNHFGVIANLFRQIGGHSSRFVLFCSFC